MYELIDARVVGTVIRDAREYRGLSQEVASGLAAISRTHLSKIERGKRKPTLETFCRIADALQFKASDILAEIENRNEQAERGGKSPALFFERWYKHGYSDVERYFR